MSRQYAGQPSGAAPAVLSWTTPCARSDIRWCLSQSYSVVSGAAWIGLNSITNPGAQAWRWAGGQNYDPSVQVT